MKYYEVVSSTTEYLPESLLPSGTTPVFFDIETTGLSPRSFPVYLIGSITPDKSAGTITFRQWFADCPDEEAAVLTGFLESLPEDATLCHFNGANFDIPFIEARCKMHEIDLTPFETILHRKGVDFYPLLRPLYHFHGLPGQGQKMYEHISGFLRTDPYDGGTLINFYREYVGPGRFEPEKAAELLEAMLCHNREDLYGLYSLIGLLPMLRLVKGDLDGVSYEVMYRDREDCGAGSALAAVSDCGAGSDCVCWIGDTTADDCMSDSVSRSTAVELTNSAHSTDCAEQICGHLLFRGTVNACSTTTCQRPLTSKKITSPLSELALTLAITENTFLLKVPVIHGCYRYYFENYKDYYYLPAEDRVIPKSLGDTLPREAKVRAKKEQAFQPLEEHFLPGVDKNFGRIFRASANDPVNLAVLPKDLTEIDRARWDNYVSSLLTRFGERE